MSDYEVGQTVYMVPYDTRSKPSEATIEKIGRKWASCGWRCEFDIKTGTGKPSPGYSPTFRVFPSKEAYELEVGKQQAWSDLMMKIRGTRKAPSHLTTAEIKEIDAQIFQGE
ncbi:MAG: hypothetical protein ACPG4X_15490 [Pikeienuella sp.]